MSETTTYKAFDKWQNEFGLMPHECRNLYAAFLEQIFHDLANNGFASLLHLGKIRIGEKDGSGVRFNASTFVREARRQILYRDGLEDRDWLDRALSPLRRVGKQEDPDDRG